MIQRSLIALLCAGTAFGQEIPIGAPPAMCLWQRGTYRPGAALRAEPFQVTDEVQFGLRVRRGAFQVRFWLENAPARAPLALPLSDRQLGPSPIPA